MIQWSNTAPSWTTLSNSTLSGLFSACAYAPMNPNNTTRTSSESSPSEPGAVELGQRMRMRTWCPVANRPPCISAARSRGLLPGGGAANARGSVGSGHEPLSFDPAFASASSRPACRPSVLLTELGAQVPGSAGLNVLINAVSTLLPDLSVCVAVNPCAPALDVLIGFVGVSVSFNVSPLLLMCVLGA